MKCPKCQFENPDGTRFCGNCAESLPSSDYLTFHHTKTIETPILELKRGATFAKRFEIIEELGSNASGIIENDETFSE